MYRKLETWSVLDICSADQNRCLELHHARVNQSDKPEFQTLVESGQ